MRTPTAKPSGSPAALVADGVTEGAAEVSMRTHFDATDGDDGAIVAVGFVGRDSAAAYDGVTREEAYPKP